MKDLNRAQINSEYSRIMEKRIRYYAEKYDPHTIFHESKAISFFDEQKELKRKSGIAMFKTYLLNIF